MDIGIGLPSAIPGVDGRSISQWASKAESSGFSSLAVIDRLLYPSYDPIVALTAAAAVTTQIHLVTSILITPLRTTAIVAKQLASLDHLSGGRLSVGVGLGGREDDYLALGRTPAGRGALLERQLREFRQIWAGARPDGCSRSIGPEPEQADGPPLYVGAFTERAISRAVAHGDGWISGGLPPEAFAGVASAVRSGWQDAGRAGSPRLLANVYFSLGPGGRESADAYILDYYAFMGDQAQYVAAAVATSEEAVRNTIDAYAQAGCDELLFFPCTSDPSQVELLAGCALA